jgi:tetratricopeptide (TPR) repeat protein
MSNLPDAQHPRSYADRGEALLTNAPEQVLNCLAAIASSDYSHSLTVIQTAIAALEDENPDWVGSAYCFYAHCLKQTSRYQKALKAAEYGKQRGLNLIGAWYYHDATVSSYNFLDDLAAALTAVDQAIEYFRTEGSPDNESDHLSRKANILKQIASPLSQLEQSKEAAKKFVLQAIQAICAAIAITEYWDDLREELSVLSRIAARLNIEASDLSSLQEMGPTVAPVVQTYFPLTNQRRDSASENHNRSVAARKKGNREEAARFLKRAFDVAPEASEEDRAFKTLIAYQHGVNLLRLNNLENYHPRLPLSSSQRNDVTEIRSVWNECLRLYSTISEQHLNDFNKRFANLSDAVSNIRADALMFE